MKNEYNFNQYKYWLHKGIYQFLEKTETEMYVFNITHFMSKIEWLNETNQPESKDLVLCKLQKCCNNIAYNAYIYSCKAVFKELGCITPQGDVYLENNEIDILEEILEDYDEDLFYYYIREYKRNGWA